MEPPHFTGLSVPEYGSDIRLISFGGTPQRPKILQRASQFTETKTAEINIGCKQPLPKLSSEFGEDAKSKDMVNR